MRKEYDFSHGARRNTYAPRLARASHANVAPLTKAQIRRLDREVEDIKDRRRFLLVSGFGPRFALYYNVSEDNYGMNEPLHATLFKRRKTALAVRQLLGPGVAILECRVDRRNRLILDSFKRALRTVGRGKRRAV